MDNHLDQKLPNLHHPGTVREDIHAWLEALGLMDSWRYMNLDSRDYTRPKHKNRLDYCFLSVDLLQDHLDKVYHVRNRKWYTEDHIPVEFSLQAKIVSRGRPPPWRCPTWLLNDSSVRAYLRTSVNTLGRRIKLFPGANPGCSLDNHKRADCIFLSNDGWNFATLITDALLNCLKRSVTLRTFASPHQRTQAL